MIVLNRHCNGTIRLAYRQHLIYSSRLISTGKSKVQPIENKTNKPKNNIAKNNQNDTKHSKSDVDALTEYVGFEKVINDPETAMNNDYNTCEDSLDSKRKKSLLVPRVQSTDHISKSDIHIEGLFAGFKPLFLGNSSIQTNEYGRNGNTSLLPGGTLNINDLLRFLTKGNENKLVDVLTSDGEKLKKPVIPWDVSISGLTFDDQSFNKVPRKIVTNLKPFRIERKKRSDNTVVNELIEMRVHNPKINDELELVDIFDKSNRNGQEYRKVQYNKEGKEIYHVLKKNAQIAKKRYKDDLKRIAFRYKFVRDDQIELRNDTNRLNNFLLQKFYKMTKLQLLNEPRESILPLSIYFQSTKTSKRTLRNFLKRKVDEQILPVLATVVSSIESPTDANQFEERMHRNIKGVIKDLIYHLPSVYFRDSANSVESVVMPSPVPGFKRMYWLKYSKRKNTFWGKNIHKEYVFNMTREEIITRNGIKYLKHPISIYWKTIDEVFNEWVYFN